MPTSSPAEALAVLQRGQECEARGTPADIAQAIQCYEEGIARWEVLLRENAPNAAHHLGIAWMNRANALQLQGTPTALAESEKSYERAISALEKAAPETDLGARNTLGAAWMNRGLALHRMGSPEAIAASERCYRNSVSALGTLPLDVSPWFGRNLAAALMNLSNVLLDARPVGRFAESRESALAALPLLVPAEKSDLMMADLALKTRRSLCDALGQLLANPPPPLDRTELAAEASDVVDDALALIRFWQAQDPRLTSELAIRFYRFGAQLYRFHQPQFLAEFLLENVVTAPPAQAAEFHAIAAQSLTACLNDLRPRQFLSVDNPAHARVLEITRDLESAQAEFQKLSATPAQA